MYFNIKLLFLFCAIVQVRSCDDYYKCLGDFVQNLFGDTNVTEVESRTDNDTELIGIEDLRNETVSFFDLSELGKTVTQALMDVVGLIKDEITVGFNVDKEVDIHKELENKTEIHAKAFSLTKRDNNTQLNNKNTTEFQIPKIIENNLTQFNEELSALKIEIENNLKSQIEAFISQVIENDTLDWVDTTQNDLYDEQLVTTTESTDIVNENIKSATANPVNKDVKNVSETTIASTTKSPIYTTKYPAVFMKSSTEVDAKETSVKESIQNINVINITTTTKSPIYTTKHPTTFMKRKEVETKSKTKKTPSTHIDRKDLSTGKPKNNNTTIITPLDTKTTKRFSTNIDATTIAAIISTTSKVPKKNTILTSNAPSSTTVKVERTSPKPKEKVTQIENRTKAPINFKLIENFKFNEISRSDVDESYYDIPEDNSTDYPMIDYVDMYKDTTNEPVEYVSTPAPENLDIGGRADLEEVFKKDNIQEYVTNKTNVTATNLPWLATIFIKNGTDNQFNYVCDGALLSESSVLTAATCLLRLNATVDADDVIVFLGKRSLQTTAEGETIHKVKKLDIPGEFSLHEEIADNDLAFLTLESPAVFSDSVAPAIIEYKFDGEAFTTAWGANLSPIRLVETSKSCDTKNSENLFCASYGNEVTVCPSYGSIYYKQSSTPGDQRTWIYAVRTTTAPRSLICLNRKVTYTPIMALMTTTGRPK